MSNNIKDCIRGTSLEVQWSRLHALTAGGVGLIPGQGTEIPYAEQHGQKTEIVKKLKKKTTLERRGYMLFK